MLDREVEPALAAVLQKEAQNIGDLRCQFEFVLDLLREDADDRSCVLRQAQSLKVLLDRYFGAQQTTEPLALAAGYAVRPNSVSRVLDDGLLNEAILDSLPDRVAVITTDYRYIYSNSLNARRFSEKPIDLVGRHIVEFIGLPRFESRVKRHLDRCFAGDLVEYDYIATGRGSAVTRCRMTPCLSAAGNVIGAILVLQDFQESSRDPMAA